MAIEGRSQMDMLKMADAHSAFESGSHEWDATSVDEKFARFGDAYCDMFIFEWDQMLCFSHTSKYVG